MKGHDKDDHEDEDHGEERKEAEDGDLDKSEVEDAEDFLWAVAESRNSSVESMDDGGVTVFEGTDASTSTKQLLESQAMVIMISSRL